MRRPVLPTLLAGAFALAASVSSAAELEVVTLYDPENLETPESINFDHHGNMFVSLALNGEIRKITPDGTETTLATLPLHPEIVPCQNSFGLPVMGGLTLDPQDNIYVSVNSCEAASLGVWKVTPEGDSSLLTNLPFPAAPNGIAYHAGFLYVADTAFPAVWKIDASSGEATIWTQDPLLLPNGPPPPLTPGPNGLQVFRHEVYVAVSWSSTIVAFKIGPGGTAGPGRVHANVDLGIGMGVDDFAFDAVGNIYATTDPFERLLKITKDGAVEVLECGGLLDGPAAAAFGVREGDNDTLYIANAAFPFFPCPRVPCDPNEVCPPRAGPSILKMDVGVPGAPR